MRSGWGSLCQKTWNHFRCVFQWLLLWQIRTNTKSAKSGQGSDHVHCTKKPNVKLVRFVITLVFGLLERSFTFLFIGQQLESKDIIGLCLRLVKEDHRITELNLGSEKNQGVSEHNCKGIHDLCPKYRKCNQFLWRKSSGWHAEEEHNPDRVEIRKWEKRLKMRKKTWTLNDG